MTIKVLFLKNIGPADGHTRLLRPKDTPEAKEAARAVLSKAVQEGIQKKVESYEAGTLNNLLWGGTEEEEKRPH